MLVLFFFSILYGFAQEIVQPLSKMKSYAGAQWAQCFVFTKKSLTIFLQKMSYQRWKYDQTELLDLNSSSHP